MGRESSFKSNILYKVNKSTTIRFWEDPWLFNVALRQKFAELFSKARSEGKMVSEVGFASGEHTNWLLEIPGRLSSIQRQQLGMIQEKLNGVIFNWNEEEMQRIASP